MVEPREPSESAHSLASFVPDRRDHALLWRALAGASIGLLLILAAAPLLVLVGELVRASGHGRGADLARAAVQTLVATETVSTLLAALAAAALATAIGFCLACYFVDPARGRAAAGLRFVLGGALLIPLAQPAVFLGGVISDLTGCGPAPSSQLGPALSRWAGLVVTWAFCFAPLAALACAYALRSLPRAEWVAARAMLGMRTALRVLLWPRLRGTTLWVGAAIAAMAFNDLVTPPHFGVETLSSRIAFDFQTSLDREASGAAALPPWLALVAILLLLARPARTTTNLGRGRAPVFELGRSWLVRGVVTAYFLLAVLLPIGLAWRRVARAGARATDVFTRHAPEIENALVFGFAAALIGACVGLLATLHTASVQSPNAWFRRLLFVALALPLCAPGLVMALTAVGMGAALPASMAPLAWWLVFSIRCAAFGGLALLLAGRSRATRAAAVLGVGFGRRVRIALRGEGLLLVAIAAFSAAACAWRDVDLWGAGALPDSETLTVRAAQSMHFGFRAPVCEAMLLQAGLAFVWGCGLLFSLSRLMAAGSMEEHA